MMKNRLRVFAGPIQASVEVLMLCTPPCAVEMTCIKCSSTRISKIRQTKSSIYTSGHGPVERGGPTTEPGTDGASLNDSACEVPLARVIITANGLVNLSRQTGASLESNAASRRVWNLAASHILPQQLLFTLALFEHTEW